MNVKAYNYVYLHAKSILPREEDVFQLTKEVLLDAKRENVSAEEMRTWAAKEVYLRGCAKFRKKKVREAELIELDDIEFDMRKLVDQEKTQEVIWKAMDELPDMYQATLYAFYYDRLSLKEIATVMGYSEEAMINRLNYMHKYFIKSMEHYREEHDKIRVEFSVEMLLAALKAWSEVNVLDEENSDRLHEALCSEMSAEDFEIAWIEEESKTDVEIRDAISEELGRYSRKRKADGKVLVFAGVALIFALVVTLGVILALGKVKEASSKKPAAGDTSAIVQDQDDKDPTDDKEQGTEESDQNKDQNTGDKAEGEAGNGGEGSTGESNQTGQASEYIFPSSDKAFLTRDDLAGKSLAELRLARNEIFARHGMIFGADDLKEYFGKKSWYKPTVPFDDFDKSVEMNEYEEKNIQLINKVEDEIPQ